MLWWDNIGLQRDGHSCEKTSRGSIISRLAEHILYIKTAFIISGFVLSLQPPNYSYMSNCNYEFKWEKNKNWVEKHNKYTYFHTGHEGTLNGLMNMTQMWIRRHGRLSRTIISYHRYSTNAQGIIITTSYSVTHVCRSLWLSWSKHNKKMQMKYWLTSINGSTSPVGHRLLSCRHRL